MDDYRSYLDSLSGGRQIPSQCLSPLPSTKSREQQCVSRRRDRLSFADYDEVCEIPHFLEMTQGEIDDTWITPDEEEMIHQHCKSLIRLISSMEEGQSGDAKKPQNRKKQSCLRGLYEHAPSHMKEQEATRQRIYDTVKVAQQYQSATCCVLPDLVLAKFCQKFSLASAEAARVKGISDAADVKNEADVLQPKDRKTIIITQPPIVR
jgi:hypothetical protein